MAKEYLNLTSSQLIDKAIMRKEGVLATNGALCVETGARTGRSPKDRFIIREKTTQDEIEWGNINRPISEETFNSLWRRVEEYLNSKQESFVSTLHVGSDPSHYLPVIVRTETAWQNLFGQNLFIRPKIYNPALKNEWNILNEGAEIF